MTPNPSGPPKLFDRALLRQHQERSGTGTDFITGLVIADLHERLATISRRFEKALISGPDAAVLPASSRSADDEIAFTRAASLVPWDGPLSDPEQLHLPDKDYDLIVSLLELQTVNDVPGFLNRLRAHLRPDGLLMLAAIGGSTLQELRTAWLSADSDVSGGAYMRVAPFIEVRDAGALLQRAGFALPVADLEHHVVRYKDPLALMRDLRALGATNPLADRPRKPATKALLGAAMQHYAGQASDPDGRVRATLDILWLSGWAPHESQQKPLKPGSAEVSLTEVLNKK